MVGLALLRPQNRVSPAGIISFSPLMFPSLEDGTVTTGNRRTFARKDIPDLRTSFHLDDVFTISRIQAGRLYVRKVHIEPRTRACSRVFNLWNSASRDRHKKRTIEKKVNTKTDESKWFRFHVLWHLVASHYIFVPVRSNPLWDVESLEANGATQGSPKNCTGEKANKYVTEKKKKIEQTLNKFERIPFFEP